MSCYKVTGARQYRGHNPGTLFEADLGEEAEMRAVARGSIKVVESGPSKLVEGSYKLPRDWPHLSLGRQNG